MSKYAKAIAGALTVLIVFVVGELGLDLDENVTAAIGTLVTAFVVWRVPNSPDKAPRKSP